MKEKIERFLQGHIYPALIVLISFVIWTFRFYVSEDMIISTTLYSMFLLTFPLFVILVFFKNTTYTIPILLSIIFSIGITKIDIDSIHEAWQVFIHLALVFIGMAFHLINYRVKIKLHSLGISFIFVILYFVIPLIYTPINEVSLLLSSLGFIYAYIYLFYANTIKGNQVHYLMRVFALLGIMLSLQLFSGWLYGLSLYEGDNVLKDFLIIFPTDFLPGWSNINDLTILLVLFSSSIIYYLHKYPKSIFPWLLLGWIGFWIYISDSRGSIVTITISALGCFIYAIFKRDKRQLINLVISLLLVGFIMILLSNIVKEVWNSFFSTIDMDDPNGMLTGRITLWWDHEHSAWSEFLRYPIFGKSWYTESYILNSNENRLTVYHSTFFHVLATGGIFGILVLIFHFFQIGTLFKKHIKHKAVAAFLFTYILTQLHGLIDNTQYFVFYSIVTYVSFAVFDHISDETLEVIDETKV